MPVPRLIAAAALLVLTAGCSFEARTTSDDDTKWRVRGRVLDADGSPYAGARVEVGESFPDVSRAARTFRSRAQTTSGGDGKFRLDVTGDSYATSLRVTTTDGRSATVTLVTRRRVDVPDLRLWAPRSSVARTAGTAVRLSWSPAPYDSVSYGVRLPGGDFPDVAAAPDRQIVVDPLRDGPGSFALVADATVAEPSRYTVHLEAPVTDAAVDVQQVRPVRCTAVDTRGRATTVAGCRVAQPVPEDADGAPSFVYAELPRPVAVAAVRIEGCSFFCSFYVSADGRHWREHFADDDRVGPGTDVRIVRPDTNVTTRWLGVASRLTEPFEGDGPADVARDERGMAFRTLAVYPGRPSTTEVPRRPTYREPDTVRFGEGRDRGSGDSDAAPVDREGPLPATALSVALLLVVAAGVVAFVSQGRPRLRRGAGGAR